MTMTPEDIARRCQKMKKHGRGYDACCPAHDDHTPSLSINPGTNGGVVLHCHAGCTAEAIVAALGLTLADLMPEPMPTMKPSIVATYDYTDEDGQLLYQVVRMQPKTFRQRKPNARGDWDWSLNGTRRVLFHLPKVIEAVSLGQTIYIVEGEKDVLALEALGLTATTNPAGAGKWKSEYNVWLDGATIYIIPDNDAPGKHHAEDVLKSLKGIATVDILTVPPQYKDVSDWIAAGATANDLIPPPPPVPEPDYYLLADLFARPELLLPPPVIVPRLAWEGRVTLLTAREKVGKSTLMGQAVAQSSHGPCTFLGDDIDGPRRTLWLALDEPLGDLVRRLSRYTAHPERIGIRTTRPDPELFARIIQMVGAQLVVIDHLTAYGSGVVKDANQATDLEPLLKTLRTIAQATKAGIVLLHHSAKGSGDYRDSTAIGAGVDAMVLMKPAEDDPDLRVCTCKGRVPNVDFKMAYVGGLYDVVENNAVSLTLQVQRFITANPGCSTRQIMGAIVGRSDTILAKVNEIEASGLIENRGEGQRSSWYTRTR